MHVFTKKMQDFKKSSFLPQNAFCSRPNIENSKRGLLGRSTWSCLGTLAKLFGAKY